MAAALVFLLRAADAGCDTDVAVAGAQGHHVRIILFDFQQIPPAFSVHPLLDFFDVIPRPDRAGDPLLVFLRNSVFPADHVKVLELSEQQFFVEPEFGARPEFVVLRAPQALPSSLSERKIFIDDMIHQERT